MTDPNPYLPMSKELKYKANIERSLHEMYYRMTEQLLHWLPQDEDVDVESLTREQEHSIDAVLAIEQEWIIDPEQREQFTLIHWTPD